MFYKAAICEEPANMLMGTCVGGVWSATGLVHPIYLATYPFSYMLKRSRPHARGQGYTSQATTFGGSNTGENTATKIVRQAASFVPCITQAYAVLGEPAVRRSFGQAQQFVVIINLRRFSETRGRSRAMDSSTPGEPARHQPSCSRTS